MAKKLKSKPEKIFRVSVGISAFNEEGNIKNVLEDILSQKQNNWELSEILLQCDGCKDNTAQVAQSINVNLIKVSEHKQRKGVIFRVNQVLKSFSGDILVLFDADVRLKDRNVINYLIEKFINNSDVMLVGGNSKNYPPKSFFQKAIYTSYEVYYKSREEIKGGHNVFGCTGACLALREEFAKRVIVPIDVVSEDTFFYFSCLSLGYKFRLAKRAVVYFKLAGNLKDFLKQVFRSHPESVSIIYKKYFGDLIDKEYKRPLGFYLKTILQIFLKNPIGTTYMILLKIFCKPFYSFFSKKYKLEWFTAVSTKFN
jgi:cellulose synthase/poly-beta-1,6-N-acetylglucosamine synthase-like glycosyltransferase